MLGIVSGIYCTVVKTEDSWFEGMILLLYWIE